MQFNRQAGTAARSSRLNDSLCSISKMGMLYPPFFQRDSNPENIDTQRDHAQQQPEQPFANQLNGLSIKCQTAAANDRMLDPPAVLHAQRPRIADSQCEYRDQKTQNTITDLLGKLAVKIGFAA